MQAVPAAFQTALLPSNLFSEQEREMIQGTSPASYQSYLKQNI